ncbi:MAG: carboxypeptidase-like regulatory domain-containing protein [Burkholderiales bacterium]
MQGEVSYLSGGIGQTEASAIKHAAKRYPLELEFVLKAKPKDEYLANVKVKIEDAHDKVVLDATADGPFLLAKMPAGKYTVTADRDGKIEQRQVEIAAKEHRRVVFEWKS